MGAAGEGRGRVALGPGGEFDLIRSLLGSEAKTPDDVLVGPGDDGAVLRGGWVLSTDLTVEDVHFRRGWLADREVGYRAAAAALSDLAAMAADPLGILVSLAMPVGRVDVEAVYVGIREAIAGVGAVVLGGDVSRSPGPLVLDVVVVGRSDRPASRAGAVPGDELWVTGALGGAAAAVELWEHGRVPNDALRDAFARPKPRLSEARFLVEGGEIHALIDLSDGLAGDAGHLAAAGGVRIVLETDGIPVAPAATDALGAGDAKSLALHGGEDYELLLAAPAGAVDPASFAERFGLALTRVGRVEAGEGVWIEDEEGTRRLERGGYSHVKEVGE